MTLKGTVFFNLSKTIMAHYDFEYDGGKGYQSGQGFMKKNLINSSLHPL